MDNLIVLVACHKDYDVIKSDIYKPIQVGSAINKKIEGFLFDDSGDNISEKNPYFCELTALYYAYKNLNCDYVGLVHYRRYFKGNAFFNCKGKKIGVLSNDEITTLLKTTDVILPKQRNYYIQTLYKHYKSTMYVEPLDITGNIIKSKYPSYYDEFLLLKKRKTTHLYNMFIMKKSILDDYAKWLFDILFELEKQVDVKDFSQFHARFFGRISELLLDVYLNANQITYKEVKVVNTEKQNWVKKIYYFLISAIFGHKYQKSL